MAKLITESVASGSPWETLKREARQSIQQFVQRLLEAEIDASARRNAERFTSPVSRIGSRAGILVA